MIAVIGGAGTAIIMKAKPPAEDGEPMVMKEDDIIAERHGCAFNMAVKLARMGWDVSFAALVGDDMLGLAVKELLRQEGINTDHVETVKGASSVKVEILNVLGDPEFQRVNETIYEKITPEVVGKWRPVLEEAEAIVMDGDLPAETIEYIASAYGGSGGKKIFFDPASTEGGIKAAAVLDKLYCVMPGRMEAEAMTKKTILSEEQLMDAGRFFAEKGVRRTIITMKGGGLYYKEGEQEGVLRPERILSFARTTGAGDAASAAAVAADLEGKSIDKTAAMAMEAAAALLAERKDEKFV